MKIFILKLLSLSVLILGIISLGIALGVTEVQDYLNQVPQLLTDLQGKLPPQVEFLKGALTVQSLWFGGSVIAIVLGIYGFFPQLAKYRRKKKIAYEGPHGEVQIQLDSVEQSLNQVLARMPEIKKITLRVDPQDGGRKAHIRADVVLNQQPGQNARAIAALVSDYIAETATKLLGLEELAKIDLNVVGINVNTRKSSKAIRKESLSHSANAPVELLEAAPAPLTLSGPKEPIGSEPIEEEIDEEAESALDTSAVDTKQEEANQAAARSELLEPLNMGESASQAPAEAGAPAAHDPESAGDEEAEETEPALETISTVNSKSVTARQMDVLNEPLEASAGEEELEEEMEEEEELAGDDEAEPITAEEYAGEDADEAPLVEEDAEDDMPVATAEAEDPEDAEEIDAPAPSYPWETPSTAAPTGGEEADGHQEEETFTAEVPGESGEEESDEPESSDSMLGDVPGGVTIPETHTEETPAPEAEKKRWGSWFN